MTVMGKWMSDEYVLNVSQILKNLELVAMNKQNEFVVLVSNQEYVI